MKRTNAAACAASFLLFLGALSCAFSPATGSLSITVRDSAAKSAAGARTLLPSVELHRATLSPVAGDDIVVDFRGGTAVLADIPVGGWDLSVQGLDEAGLVVTRGMTAIVITAGTQNSVVVALYATNPGLLGQNEAFTVIWQGSLGAAPVSPELDWAYYDTGSLVSLIWDGAAWRTLDIGWEPDLVWKGALGSVPAPEFVEAYWDSALGSAFIWDATAWSPLTVDLPPVIAWQGSLPAAPATPVLDWAYYDSDLFQSFIWDGEAWQTFDVPDSFYWFGIFSGPPTTPLPGYAYYDTTLNVTRISYDGISWTPLTVDWPPAISWQGSLAAAPASPSLDWAYYDSVLLQSFIWDGAAWQSFDVPANFSWLGMLAAEPPSPILDWAYYDSAKSQAFIFDDDGAAWIPLTAEDAPGNVSVALTFPGNLGITGVDAYWDSVLVDPALPIADTLDATVGFSWMGTYGAAPVPPGVDWAYYDSFADDAFIWNGSVWTSLTLVPLTSPFWHATSATAPPGPDTGWAYYDSALLGSYIWDGAAWIPMDGADWRIVFETAAIPASYRFQVDFLKGGNTLNTFMESVIVLPEATTAAVIALGEEKFGIPPAAPEILSGTYDTGIDLLDLSWNFDGITEGVDIYYQDLSINTDFIYIATVSNTATTYSATLTFIGWRRFWVVAFNAYGQSEYSGNWVDLDGGL